MLDLTDSKNMANRSKVTIYSNWRKYLKFTAKIIFFKSFPTNKLKNQDSANYYYFFQHYKFCCIGEFFSTFVKIVSEYLLNPKILRPKIKLLIIRLEFSSIYFFQYRISPYYTTDVKKKRAWHIVKLFSH